MSSAIDSVEVDFENATVAESAQEYLDGVSEATSRGHAELAIKAVGPFALLRVAHELERIADALEADDA